MRFARSQPLFGGSANKNGNTSGDRGAVRRVETFRRQGSFLEVAELSQARTACRRSRSMKRVVTTLLLLCAAAAAVRATDPAAQSLLDGGHWKRLRTMAEPRFSANPNDAEAAYLLGYSKSVFGDLDGAQALAEKALAANGGNADYHFLLARIIGQKAEKAGIFKGMSLASKFKKECDAALAINPNHVEALRDLMDYYYEAPGIAGGDKKKAWEITDRIMKIDAAQGYLAQVDLLNREKNKDWPKIESLELKAVEAGPRNYEAQVALAGLYGSSIFKKFEQAEQLDRTAIKLDPGRSAAYAQIVQLFVQQARWTDLDTFVAQAEKNVPDDFNPEYQAAKALLTEGKDLLRAERYIRNYLTQEPEAETPPSQAAHWRLGQVLEKEGRKQEAIAEMETALKIQPDFKQAKDDLRRLKSS
jgi:tetratricopeptide (TPR) repeat protein